MPQTMNGNPTPCQKPEMAIVTRVGSPIRTRMADILVFRPRRTGLPRAMR
jgi:hypothetical protein